MGLAILPFGIRRLLESAGVVAMNLYNLKTTELGFRITKFSMDLDMESSYTLTDRTCDCPQGHKPTCRHRRMLPLLKPRVDTAWFLCFETSQWSDPTGQAEQAYDERYNEETAKALDIVERDLLPGVSEALPGPEPAYGVGPVMEAVKDLKAFNELPEAERLQASKEFVQRQLATPQALPEPTPVHRRRF